MTTDAPAETKNQEPGTTKPHLHIIYHRSDFDGLFCREIARYALTHEAAAAANWIGYERTDPVPDIPRDPGHIILMMDISIPELMDHPALIWIDHHKTAMEKWDRSDLPGSRCDGIAACRLAWDYLLAPGNEPHRLTLDDLKSDLLGRSTWFAGSADKISARLAKDEPRAVTLAGRYDVWDLDDDVLNFQHGLKSRFFDAKVFENLVQYSDCSIEIEQGKLLRYVAAQDNAQIIAANGFTVHWEGLTFLACNAGRYNSQLFEAGIRPEHDGLIGFCLRAGGRWSVSLYGVPGKPDIDLSAIATKHGGGGHQQACGFLCDWPPFLSTSLAND